MTLIDRIHVFAAIRAFKATGWRWRVWLTIGTWAMRKSAARRA